MLAPDHLQAAICMAIITTLTQPQSLIVTRFITYYIYISQNLAGYSLFSCIDLVRAFHQIPVALLNKMLFSPKKERLKALPWTTAMETFQNCKEALSRATLLAYPGPDLHTSIQVAASDVTLGAVLQQLVDGCLLFKPAPSS